MKPNLIVRPDVPVNGQSREVWADKNRRALSDYYRFNFGHYPDDVEWLEYINLQYEYQRLRDAELERMELDI
jgi:hypothetical protein